MSVVFFVYCISIFKQRNSFILCLLLPKKLGAKIPNNKPCAPQKGYTGLVLSTSLNACEDFDYNITLMTDFINLSNRAKYSPFIVEKIVFYDIIFI